MLSRRVPRCLVTTVFVISSLLFLLAACAPADIPDTLLLPTPVPATTFVLEPPSPEDNLPAAEIFAALSPAVAFVETETASGSSVLLDGGFLLTNAHVVWPYESVRVAFPDGSEYTDVPVVGWDLLADLALIGPVDTEIGPVALVDGGQLNVGEDVYLIGYPAEVDEFPQPTITNGILSRLRNWEAIDYTFYQVDATITGGQSGGVMVTHAGDIIGISTFYYSGFGMAGSVADALPRLNALLGHDTGAVLDHRPFAAGRTATEFTGTLDGQPDERKYILDEPVGTEVELTVTGVGRPQLVVVGLSGMPVAETQLLDFDQTDAQVSFEVERKGPLIVLVSQPSENENDYTLQSSHPLTYYRDRDDHQELAVGNRYVGALDSPEDADVYSLALEEGDRLTLAADALALDLQLILTYESETLAEVVIDDDSGGGIFGDNPRLVYEVPEAGDYRLFVTASYGDDVGNYLLAVEEADADAEATEPVVSRELLATGYGSMATYEHDDGRITVLYPAEWEGVSPANCGAPDASACFVGDIGLMMILDEPLSALPRQERHRDGYLAAVEEALLFNDVEIISRTELTTIQGLPVTQFEVASPPERISAMRNVYVNEEEQSALSLTLVVREEFAELTRPMVDLVLESFRYWEDGRQEGDPVYHLDQALRLASADDDPGALVEYDRSIDLDPDLSEAYKRRAWVHYRLEDSDAALADLDRVLALEPDDHQTYAGRAMLHWIRNDVDAARTDIDRAIDLRPARSQYYNTRALIRADQDDFEGALADIETIIDLSSGELFPNVQDTRAYIYLIMGELEESKADYDEIFAKDARFPYALLGAGVVYGKLGDLDQARALILEGRDELDDDDLRLLDPQLDTLLEMAREFAPAAGD